MFLSYANSPNNKPEGNINKATSIEINSCGAYTLYTKKELPTHRSMGRSDYQLIYIAAGRGYFYFNNEKPTILEAGNMVLYHPYQPQKYIYYGVDHPEIYWIHFTGSDIDALLEEFNIDIQNNTIYSGVNPDYAHIFKMIIWELQLQKSFFQESSALYFRQLLIMLGRFNCQNTLSKINTTTIEIEQATAYFHEHYNENINIEEYVDNICLSNSVFFRKFKLYTGMTPLQYILDIRLSTARSLLETTNYSVNEIALIVGYENALYFSRLFHKHTGMSPRDYREMALTSR